MDSQNSLIDQVHQSISSGYELSFRLMHIDISKVENYSIVLIFCLYMIFVAQYGDIVMDMHFIDLCRCRKELP